MNKTNPRKEFFRVDIATIFTIVKEHHGEVEYVIDAEAKQYRDSLTMPEDDEDFIASVYNDLDDDAEIAASDL